MKPKLIVFKVLATDTRDIVIKVGMAEKIVKINGKHENSRTLHLGYFTSISRFTFYFKYIERGNNSLCIKRAI